MIIKKRRVNKLHLLSRMLGLTGLIFLLIGAVISWGQHQANVAADQNPTAPLPHDATTRPSTNQPSQDEFTSHTVPTYAPRYIFIPKISVKAMVKPVGVTADNNIDAPNNVFDTGWYTGSAKPGHEGAMLIDGHVSSETVHGVFYNLKKLKPNDTIQIERGDGTLLEYRVVKSIIYAADAVDMTAALTPVTPEKPGLNLISCTGNVIRGTNDFNERLVVYAEQL